MTTAELHEILDDENRKLTADELKEVINKLLDSLAEQYRKDVGKPKTMAEIIERRLSMYIGEMKAFHICLDLLEHLKGE